MARIILLTTLEGADLAQIKADFRAADAVVTVVRDRVSLDAQAFGDDTTLVSFGTGVIVPPATLGRLRRKAYNVHAASPAYPGRDPHHFAIYDGAVRYGATMHVMTERVDAGPIVAVDLFDVPQESRPRQLLQMANEAGMRLIGRHAQTLASGMELAVLAGVAWAPVKRSRQDFLAACRITADISSAEFERRFKAFDGEGYDNLTLDVHGRLFRIDKCDGRRP